MQQPATNLFNVGDVCVDRTTYTPAKAGVQRVQIRKFNGDGSKAIVHYVHCPQGMVFAVNVKLLNVVDADGFLCPSPYMCIYKRRADEEEDCASSKRTKNE